MRPGRPLIVLAVCAGWLALTTGYGAAATGSQVDLGGSPVPGGTGSTDQARPTVLEPGLWTDSLGDAESPYRDHFFRYERQIQNSTVHVGVVGESSDDYDGFELSATGPDQTDCGSVSASPSDSSVPQAVFGAELTIGGSEPGDTSSPCLTAGEIDLKLERSTQGSSKDDELPVAIKVVEEAPVPSAAELPAPPDSPSYDRITDVSGGEHVDGAGSFDAAPPVPLSGGRADFSTSVTEGEERLFRVPLAWGQALSVAAHAPKLDEKTYVDVRSYTGVAVSVQVVGPLRDTVTGAVSDVATSGSYDDSEPLDLSDALPPVGYLNRWSSLPADVPGDYWISIAASPKPDAVDEPLAVPLDVAVELTDQSGAPSYSGGVLAQGGGKFTGSYDPARPFLIGPGQFAAVASGSPVAPGDEDSGWWGTRRYAGLALLVAGAASCAAGLWRLRASSRRHPR
ncbi:hypothetical protein [Nocardioides panacisoli]|uniref:Peptidase n=1 Tax=Nocardioides panacisoli TaxID=627624 RepID=A0ABP7IJA6_9ACTN